ncbi:MAG: Nif11-like leader peptide family natural product precursor [Chlorobiaceae bacterium]
MSQAHAQAFLERMQSDDAFNDAVTRIEDVETKMAYINREGYDFTAEDLEMTSYPNSADQNAECP